MLQANAVLNPEFIQQAPSAIWPLISPLYAVDESLWLQELLPLAQPSPTQATQIETQASALIAQIRADDGAMHMIDALLLEYSLDTREGILLMCLAEALIRIPDAASAQALIRDKLGVADWHAHLRQSDSFLVNASTWGLLLTGKVVTLSPQDTQANASQALNRLVQRLGEPLIRRAMQQAMKIMGHQFVLGQTMQEAIRRGQPYRDKGYTYSFDMLGEAALTQADAQKYAADYAKAIEAVGQYPSTQAPRPSVSIKLSALHPRYEVAQKARVLEELCASLLTLIRRARILDVHLTIDAEEADRLELSLEVFQALYQHPEVQGWGGLGLVVQAYSKRALAVLAWLASLAHQGGDLIPVRLVKGAYWDAEIKLCQQRGLSGYPVFTRKEATDVSYLACARFLLSEPVRGKLWPQFASHNAHTLVAIQQMASHQAYEFQRLHGMGDALHDRILASSQVATRIYAPVGSHKDLLPYLVRRLLENGANSSFVHVDANCPIADLVQHPWHALSAKVSLHNPHIPLPVAIYGSERPASTGPNLFIDSQATPFLQAVAQFHTTQWQASASINGQTPQTSAWQPVYAPWDHSHQVGQIAWSSPEDAHAALNAAADYQAAWAQVAVTERADIFRRMAQLMQTHLAELVALCQREAGKTLQDSIDEVREAVDFCYYYGARAQEISEQPLEITDLTGVIRRYQRQPRGVWVCISPWNFPLAIFLGQISAALVTGNTVVAKPAPQTSLIAYRALELLYQAGLPKQALHLVLGAGEVGAALTSATQVAGVAFTGSTPTARHIYRALAQRPQIDTPPVLIAETGGQNAMIVDSTALPEQVVKDVLLSGFASAGQRCSALRLLCVQEDIAERVFDLLQGAMAELRLGDPRELATDVGPVIDQVAQTKLEAHLTNLGAKTHILAQTPIPEAYQQQATFVAPTAIRLQSLDQLGEEEFGPFVHLLTYRANELPQLIQQINAKGYGLTLGIHSRNETTAAYIEACARVGNTYINRNQIGAVVGVQPFGGQGLSGTGPKAGGPHYLASFTHLVECGVGDQS
ncbi:RHH-type transcriptional regulator, proline utilization regulon repressor / proline dehydrogenase / delta 1-pyrroline-5-carboxylate dehydrogenase [Allopseudospirillum japonicum]|uniref:Bifunctional protein PutA n=1 Tax=Allopseudospirillum japonicum TaxID=64971 RepID=A0A1H6T4D4_9GAMM|nr:bifunctional proline dehydrogenase/L-glutamate gamma-semialdehyde dehydrogenase PutA [Allopseudospirillum japonicum]SEI71115.1 RHH-type transcriptional regulator, proline utilization regulon repressor / proline dehydrogenase / delta 1-pyrroline-5-carboxylate dehydrogenase [Allopseudospirillum japonicum]